MMATNALFSRRLWSEKDDQIAHVLAVDDSLVDRKVIERLLKTSSCKVTAVDSGMRALEFLGLDEEKQINNAVDKLKVDLIITDYCMPGMTGYDLLKKIKESSAFREVPVVIMSSENVLTRIHRCLEEGAEDFIVKPVKLSDVERLRENLMAKNKPENTFNERAPISHKRKLSEGPDLSTSPNSSESPSSIASPISLPDSTPSPPSSSRSSPSPPIPTASEPLDSPSRKQKISDTTNEIIPESPL